MQAILTPAQDEKRVTTPESLGEDTSVSGTFRHDEHNLNAARSDATECHHEHSHILDSKIHGGGYAGKVTRQIFCSRCRLQRWLGVEAALAMAQADVGIIPQQAAREI